MTTKAPSAKPTDYHIQFDGVIITGPGPARKISGGLTHPGLFNGEDVWSRLETLGERLHDKDEEVVIVRGGGTAAGVAAWMIRNGFTKKPISFIAEQPTFYTRIGDYFENKVFDGDTLWQQLSIEQRRSFVNRTTRSVVWEAVSQQLAAATNLNLIPGRVQSFSASESDADLITVNYRPSITSLGTQALDCSVVVDASDFETWWFKDLLPSPWRSKNLSYYDSKAVEMGTDLTLPIGRLPPLHVPMVSWAQGPGYSSLMILGRMADRVLSRYLNFR